MSEGGHRTLFDLFWTDHVWLPTNMTWKDVEPTEEGVHTRFSDLWYPIPLALAIWLMRLTFERRIFKPLGLALGIKDSKHSKPPTNDVLEKEFMMLKKDKTYELNCVQLSVELKMSERQIQYWMRKRKLYGKTNTLTKFCETGWRFSYFSLAFMYGLTCLWDKSWFQNIRHCWYNYPHHDVPKEIWWYYVFEMAFYWSISLSQFTDIKRKDFVEMFIHHLITICLLCFSWVCNLHRCGSLVLLIHDFADIFLDLAKLCHYAKYNVVCDLVFAFFAVSWIVTRLGIFPLWILYSSILEAPQIVQMFPVYYIFNAMLSVLLVLHVIWTYFILKIPYNMLFSDKKKQDSRSDSSDTEDDGSEETDTTKHSVNHSEHNGHLPANTGEDCSAL